MMEYFARFGAVRDYLRVVVEQAKIDGYTETIFGRRRPFPDLASPNRVLRENAERAALNAPIQGSAADIMKIALFRIHDPTSPRRSSAAACSCRSTTSWWSRSRRGSEDAEERSCARGWADAADLAVPLDVQIGRGADWNEAAH